MASWCPNCGRNIDEGEKFCRQCGMPQHLDGEEATNWILEPQTVPDSMRKTSSVHPGPTTPTNPPIGAAYIPPTPNPYYAPPHPTQYQAPVQPGQTQISLGGWLSGGWQVYKENGAVMSVASLIAVAISAGTFGLLSGPLFMGLLQMAYKTMRGERPTLGDLFDWRGRFLQSFLTGLVFVIVQVALSGAGNNNALFSLLGLGLIPFLTVLFGFTMSLVLERRTDVVNSLNEAAKLIFSRDAFMWWVVGLVFAAITFGGLVACGIGALVTLPWMISAMAVAYRDVFGIDDPNRTNH
jgi:hypothetical protein